MAGVAIGRPIEGDNDGEDEADGEPDDGEDDDEQVAPAINAQVFRMMTQMMLGDIPPTRQKIWKNIVRKVLTDTQRSQLEESDNARRLFNRKIGVMNRVQALDAMLRFSPTQREQVTEVVDRVLGKTLEEDESPKQGRTTLIYGDEAEVLPKHLKDILSPAQLNAFKESEKEASDPMMAAIQVGMGGGRRRAMPIPGAEPGGCYLGASFAMNPLGAAQDQTVIYQVVPDGPADKAGLQPRDLLKKFGDSNVAGVMGFLTGLRKFKPGQKVEVVFERDGKEMTVTLEFTERE